MSKLNKIMYVVMLTIAIIFTFSNIAKATTVEITTETLNLRKEASTDSDIVAQISVGEECEVLEEEEDWYQVKYGEYTGYISKEYTKLIGETSESNNEGENLITENNETSKTVETNTVTENNEQKNNGNENNSQETTSNENELESVQNVTATIKTKTNIKITPLINSNVIDTIQSNTKVMVIDQINGWSFIQTDEVSGWVRTDSIEMSKNGSDNKNIDDNNTDETNSEGNTEKDDNTSNFTEKTMYTTDYVNIRKGPSANSDKIMVVEPNTGLKVIEEEGDWYQVETSEGNAYVSKDVMSEKKNSVTNRGNINRSDKKETDDENNKSEAEEETSTSNSSDTSSKADEIIAYAKKFLGVPYVYGGASPSGFDCSGFTMYVYNKFDISMRHGAQAQAKLGKEVNVDKSSKSSMINNLKKGDLVFFLDYETMDEIGHCGIYIGDGDFIHASSGSGYCVKINSLLPGEYYNTRYCAARRLL